MRPRPRWKSIRSVLVNGQNLSARNDPIPDGMERKVAEDIDQIDAESELISGDSVHFTTEAAGGKRSQIDAGT